MEMQEHNILNDSSLEDDLTSQGDLNPLLRDDRKISHFKSYNKPKVERAGKSILPQPIMEQTDRFYDNQELAFASDKELKALRERCLVAERQNKIFRKQFDTELTKALKNYQSKLESLQTDVRNLKSTLKSQQNQLINKDREIEELRKTNKKLRDNYKGIEDRMQALRSQA